MVEPRKNPIVTCPICNKQGTRATTTYLKYGKPTTTAYIYHGTTRIEGKRRIAKCYLGRVTDMESAIDEMDRQRKPRNIQGYQEIIDQIIDYVTALKNSDTGNSTYRIRKTVVYNKVKRILDRRRLWKDITPTTVVPAEEEEPFYPGATAGAAEEPAQSSWDDGVEIKPQEPVPAEPPAEVATAYAWLEDKDKIGVELR